MLLRHDPTPQFPIPTRHEKAAVPQGDGGFREKESTHAFFTSTHCLVFADSSTASQTYCVPRAWRKSG